MKMLAAILLLASSAAFAGSGPSTITCKSDSGRTEFFAQSDDMFSEATAMRFTIDGQTNEFTKGFINYKFEDSVITANGSNDTAHTTVDFWAIPASVKVKAKGNPTEVLFKAKVQGSDPRSEFQEWSKVIVVNCKLFYEI